MIKPCSSPDCQTLTYGEVCLGCLQRKARELQQAAEYAEAQHCDHGSSTDPS
jgi:hypothetical protein